ncbi:hsp70 protein domain-containing protein [Phthorimaea operculella]|nr:hsp70 protein domain-containing protein [Phthorimaea operculella]
MEKLLREAERLKVVLSANTEFYAQIESLLDDKDFKQLVSSQGAEKARAMEKLFREAERLKVVLSANTEFYAQIESLLDDKDFKQLVSSQGVGNPRKPRAMEKLLGEAERLKVVLSANTEFYAQIESLLDDKDFKQLVTRQEFEELCADLWPRVTGVIQRAVAAAGGAGEGARLVLAGGGSRVPAVLQALKDAVGHDPARSINADEAACMGAVYRAASLATGYKVAALNVRDAVLLPIQVVFTRHVDGNDKLVSITLTPKV